MIKKKILNIYFVVFMFIIFLLIWDFTSDYRLSFKRGYFQKRVDEVMNLIKKNEVEKITFFKRKNSFLESIYNPCRIEITKKILHNPNEIPETWYCFPTLDMNNLIQRDLDAAKIKIDSLKHDICLSEIIINIFSVLHGPIFTYYIVKSVFLSQGKRKSNSKISEKQKYSFTFKDVAGNDKEKKEMQELVDFLKNPEKYSDIGATIPKGILLEGPPGTGKTLLAKALAGEAGVSFYVVSGSDFVEMFVGVGAARVRNLFKQAKESSPCIIFIDEIDILGSKRGGGDMMHSSNSERDQTLNQLLTEMDGFKKSKGIIIVGATNRIDVLDPALLRPGRFDRIFKLGLPDVKARKEILKVHAHNKKIAPEVDFDKIADKTSGMNGAELESVLNEASIMAIRNQKNTITMIEIEEAINRIIDFQSEKLSSGPKVSFKEKAKVTFKDVAGNEEEKEEMKELIDFLKQPKKYSDMGATIPKGVLLEGPPGTGKTLLAKALAGEANVEFYSVSGSEFVEQYVGVGASRVRKIFKELRNNNSCILFIDEIEVLGGHRGLLGGNTERDQTLNQLLTEMDGFNKAKGIIVVGATNRVDMIDSALLRPGRFDRIFKVGLPDVKAREDILRVHARNKKIAPEVDFKQLAKQTPGMSGAQLASVLNEASILTVRNKKTHITALELEEAVDRVLMGPAKKSIKYNEEEKKMVAYHEAGHAVIGLKLKHAQKVQKITIIPRGSAGGYNLMMPEKETFFSSKKRMLANVISYLGGRVAEELMFDDISSGAYDDFKQATRIAQLMVTKYGMSDLGPIQDSEFSDKKEIDHEIKKIINTCHQEARKIIQNNKTLLDKISNLLLEQETITSKEIEKLV